MKHGRDEVESLLGDRWIPAAVAGKVQMLGEEGLLRCLRSLLLLLVLLRLAVASALTSAGRRDEVSHHHGDQRWKHELHSSGNRRCISHQIIMTSYIFHVTHFF